MKINYKKLWFMIVEQEMTKQDLEKKRNSIGHDD